MKNYKITIYFVMLLGVMSCEDGLDLVPPDAVSDVSFWNSANDFKLATNNYYYTLPHQDGWDRDSDIQYGNGFNAVSSGTNMPPANDNFWNDRYATLRQINTLLQKAKEFADPDAIEVSVAEGKFFRAYEYFRLVQNFGDVPYYDEPLTVENEGLYAARTPRATVIINVLRDLDEAIPDLPLESETAGNDQGRVTQGAALALKAKVALFEATWAKYHGTEGNVSDLLNQAVNAANEVVNSGEYELFVYAPDPTLSYVKSYGIEGNDSKEQVLARRYHPDVEGNWWVNWVCCGGESDGTKKLADMYVATDGLPIDISPLFQGYGTMTSEFENRDLRMSNTLHVPGEVQLFRDNKAGNPIYPQITGHDQTGYRANKLVAFYPPDSEVWGRAYEFKHVIKYSEVLLILAEALYERDGAISDDDLNRTINLLRDRGQVASLTNALVNNNGLDMLEQIRNERTVELAFDGTRLQDLKRWKTAVAEMGEAIKGVNLASGAWDAVYPGVSTQYELDGDGFKIVQPAATRQFSERNYLFPIPTQQIQLNPALAPNNPGWD